MQPLWKAVWSFLKLKVELPYDIMIPLLGIYSKKPVLTLAGVAQWIECRPANQRVASSIPSLGHMPGLWARSPVGGGA